MKEEFTLLQSFSNAKDDGKSLLPKIRYQEYTVEVEGAETRILIPVRESESFEREMSIRNLDRAGLRHILRKYRGIKHNV
jgi:hypothetical protein